ncbi:MAG TPA: hypothetical protein VNK67_00765 [Burkholderiales bacterium]|nr:hypothetical protein [Burkholderiales bacterium]
MNCCRRFVLLLALAVLPLQGLAAALPSVACHGDAQLHAAHASGASGHEAHEGGAVPDGSAPPDSTYHLCCHYSVSAPLVATLPADAPDFQVRTVAPDPLHDLFVPEQPDRPPLA